MERLLKIAAELKAPKNRTNSFGGYKYRSLEDILEAVKPKLKEAGLMLLITDEVVNVGQSNYIMATARVVDATNNRNIAEVSAYARESVTKKGMDDAQITGTSSSYARKYALNGLFLIDDTKDPDTDEYQRENTSRSQVSENDTEQTACKEAEACTNAAELTAVWNKYPQLHAKGGKFWTLVLNKNQKFQQP